ncbi:hypothetical protein [Shewanella sp. Isolate7]|uniref:hypothetical protein n=1 Tax=Shewanella sp. Isolate7 TaxID=2908528 RepID=UPI001EFCCB14|nr:hypothetical protein [Shewanella sp. Isolate7]MCG9721858.1 hypothetical protein [Shewanella sp. Isolate7]
MNIEQVKKAVISTFQLFLDENLQGLMVGEINDNDYRMLGRGYGELEWDWGIEKFSNHPELFDFCFKIQGSDIPDGVAMGTYNLATKTLEMHMMESFVDTDREHPLRGRMTYLTLVASYLFLATIEGDTLHFVDPVDRKLEEHYKSYGLSEPQLIDGQKVQVISQADLGVRLGQSEFSY